MELSRNWITKKRGSPDEHSTMVEDIDDDETQDGDLFADLVTKIKTGDEEEQHILDQDISLDHYYPEFKKIKSRVDTIYQRKLNELNEWYESELKKLNDYSIKTHAFTQFTIKGAESACVAISIFASYLFLIKGRDPNTLDWEVVIEKGSYLFKSWKEQFIFETKSPSIPYTKEMLDFASYYSESTKEFPLKIAEEFAGNLKFDVSLKKKGHYSVKCAMEIILKKYSIFSAIFTSQGRAICIMRNKNKKESTCVFDSHVGELVTCNTGESIVSYIRRRYGNTDSSFSISVITGS